MSTYPRPSGIDVALSVGSVLVIAGADDAATVVVRPSDPERQADLDAAARAEEKVENGRLLVRALQPRRLLRGIGSNPGSVEVVLEVPAGVPLRCTGEIADVRTDGPLGDVHVKVQVGSLSFDRVTALAAKTSGGDVIVDRVDGDARITGSGDIRVARVRGTAEVRNLNGPVWVGEVGGTVRARSGSGDVVVECPHAEVLARTASGDLTVAAVRRGAVDLKTASGAVSVGVVEGTAVHVDASSRFGRVENQLTSSEAPPASGERAVLSAHTAYGDVVIHRS